MLSDATAVVAAAEGMVAAEFGPYEFAPVFLGIAILGLLLTSFVHRHRRNANAHLSVLSAGSSFDYMGSNGLGIGVELTSINIQPTVVRSWSSDSSLRLPLPSAAKLESHELQGLLSSSSAVGVGLSSKSPQRIPAGMTRQRFLIQQRMQQLLLRRKQRTEIAGDSVDDQRQLRIPGKPEKPRNSGWSFPPFENKYGRFQRWQKVLRRRPPPARPPQPALPCPLPLSEMTEALLDNFQRQLEDHQQGMWGLGDWCAMAEDERLRLLPLATKEMLEGKSLPVHCLPMRDGEESETENRERRAHLRAWLRQYLLHTLMRAGPAKSLSPILERLGEDENNDDENRRDDTEFQRECQWWDSEEMLQLQPVGRGVTRDHLWRAVALLASTPS